MIIAASIVGSGELIGTTKTGAEAGFWLLWLIVIGCVIKVFAQIEFGRFAIAEGRTSLEGMNLVPGPRLRVNWLLWYWLVMFLVGLGQLGGIVGVVGESMAIAVPLTGDKQESLRREHDAAVYRRELRKELAAAGLSEQADADDPAAAITRAEIVARLTDRLGPPPDPAHKRQPTFDELYWSWIITIFTAVLLVNGRYNLIQHVATLLVAGFTAVTVFNVFALQSRPEWSLGWAELRDAFSFRLPPAETAGAAAPLATALATFGIIGVGASELIAYPYWCLERGYARFTGPCDPSDSWAARAQGWMRVMRWDAWLSMVIYTFATIAFYLLGAAVLHREGLNIAGSQIVYTLSQMYEPVFGKWAGPVFLVGAFAVLYSTFFVATAGNARIAGDALRIFGIAAHTDDDRQWWVRLFCGVFPFLSVTIYTLVKEPVALVLVSGMIQSLMLPMLGGAALWFRYRRGDRRIAPGRLWDLLLWASCLGLLVAAIGGGYEAGLKIMRSLRSPPARELPVGDAISSPSSPASRP
ncbi:MAG: Nramp family divalent metal transporter [Pirellulales bacterium]|nr:Nramp family divalent metal transporter [Pirellulales bacterium]